MGKRVAQHTCVQTGLKEKNVMIKGDSPPHPLDMAAANRTLPSDRTLPTHMNSHKHHFRCGYTCPSLQRGCPRQVAILSVRRLSPHQICSRRGEAECGDPLVSLHPNWSAILLPPSAKRMLQNFKCLFLAGDPNVLFTSQHRCHFHQLASCISIRSADKYAILMTLERYDVASCGENFDCAQTVSRTLFWCVHSFAACLQTRIFDQQLCVSWVSFDLNTFWRFSKRWQKSYFTRFKKLWSRTQ